MGSDNIDASLFFWIFIQTCIVVYSIYLITCEIENLFIITLLKLKSITKFFFATFIRIVAIIITFYTVLYALTYGMLRLTKHRLHTVTVYEQFLNVHTGNHPVILYMNSILSTVLLVLLLCIFGFLVKSFRQSYLFLTVYQLFLLLFVKNNVRLYRFFPLTQGVFALYDDQYYTDTFAFQYQLVITIISTLLFYLLVKKNYENLY